MKKIAFLSLGLAMSISLSACSSADAGTNQKVNENSKHEEILVDDLQVDDLQKVDFMDKDFDMSQIEQRSCCDE